MALSSSLAYTHDFPVLEAHCEPSASSVTVLVIFAIGFACVTRSLREADALRGGAGLFDVLLANNRATKTMSNRCQYAGSTRPDVDGCGTPATLRRQPPNERQRGILGVSSAQLDAPHRTCVRFDSVVAIDEQLRTVFAGHADRPAAGQQRLDERSREWPPRASPRRDQTFAPAASATSVEWSWSISRSVTDTRSRTR